MTMHRPAYGHEGARSSRGDGARQAELKVPQLAPNRRHSRMDNMRPPVFGPTGLIVSDGAGNLYMDLPA